MHSDPNQMTGWELAYALLTMAQTHPHRAPLLKAAARRLSDAAEQADEPGFVPAHRLPPVDADGGNLGPSANAWNLPADTTTRRRALWDRLVAVAGQYGYPVVVSDARMARTWAMEFDDPLPSLADDGPRGVTTAGDDHAIVLREGLDADVRLRVLAHEVAHAVSRQYDPTLNTVSGYPAGEQVAETVSDQLTTPLGVAAATDEYNPAAYIASWRGRDPRAGTDHHEIVTDVAHAVAVINGTTS